MLCGRCRRFEADDKPNCVTSEGGPCSACKEREAICYQIAQLEELLAKLKAKHDAITATMNAIHDPFIHKLPTEISSHIFRLTLPTLSERENLEAIVNPQLSDRSSAEILRLGAVCRKWRQLAWATPDLWDTLYLRVGMWTKRSLAESLPDLVREWLERSRSLPLTIFFHHYLTSGSDSSDEDASEAGGHALEVAIRLVIDIFNLHSSRWRNLNLMTTQDMFGRFSGSVQPNQLLGLGLCRVESIHHRRQFPHFMMGSEFTPTHLTLGDFPLTSISIRWDNVTHLTLHDITGEDCVDVLERVPRLEYYNVFLLGRCEIRTPILHRRLRSLHLSSSNHIEDFLEAIHLPSLEEWSQDMETRPLPVATILSFFKRSGCCLKVLHLAGLNSHSKGLNTLLQAIPTLERIHLSFYYGFGVRPIMDDILARIFLPVPVSDSNLVEGPTIESFLPCLQFLECNTREQNAPVSWDCIPRLYHQGHRRSLMLKTIVSKSDISDETALQLLQLADEGCDFQIFDASIGGCFLKNARKRMREQGV